MTENKAANPAVVGLAGFGITTLLLQIHNLGLCGVGPVFCAAVMFGGLAQMIAGYFEFKCGNNFGFSAFVSYGAFWLGLALMWMLIDMKAGGASFIGSHLSVSTNDVGIFLLGYTIYTAIMFIASMRIHGAMAFTFLTLLLGFIGLDFVFLAGMKYLLTITAIDLIICAGGALYMMAGIIINDVADKPVLSMGKAWIGNK
ncbi:MAG TPA: acetate uptake transporter [Spirochaetota bacterium]|nr:acetate uptake transporter [Spirochaetota bacterium]